MTKQVKKKKRAGFRKKNLTLSLMALPAVILLFLFAYVPIGGLVIAFKDFRYDKGIFGSEWCGLKNFTFFFKSNDAWRVLRNTIGLNLLFIGVGLVVAVAIALMMNEIHNRGFIKVVQTILFFPYFLSWVVVGYLLYAYLHQEYGIINQVLQFFGLHTVSWYTEAGYWPFILTFMSVWKNAGYYSVIYYAALMGIDDSYYEAATLDGASRWQMVWKITLPLIRSVIIVMLILQIGKVMYADFGLFFNLTKNVGTLLPTTDVLDTYIYRALTKTGDIGISAAVGCFQAVVGFVMIFGTNLIVRKIDSDSALF